MSALVQHPYASFLHRVEKPARYLGGEHNQIVKDPAQAAVQIALAFPDVYDIGMSHLGTKILYSVLNKTDDILCERAFAPWPDMEAELRERGLPVLTLENHRPLSEFDAVGFSLQYELTFTNMLNLMDLSGIPIRNADRSEADPLIVAGGPVATQPEPVAPFVDVFLIGDAEEKLPEMLRRLAECRDAGLTRRERLIELAKLDGLYCPDLYDTEIDLRTGFQVVTGPNVPGIPERPQRAILEDLDRFPYPDDAPVANAEAIFDRLSVEIARGCTEGCRFCQAGMIYRPVRERDPEQVIDTVLTAIDKAGYDEAGLTTLSTADYSCISPLMKELMGKLKERNVSLSVASLRAYGMDEDTLDEMASYRAQGLTFAPEAGTQRMRDVVNKNVTEDDMAQTAHRVFSRGWRRMKLYFMIGLPTERDEDVAGIMETGRRMKNIGREHMGPRADVTVSVSSHVPKPHTPFQWVAMDSMEEIERKQDLLQELGRRYRLEFRRHDPRTSFLEGILGRGDRRVAAVVEAAFRAGARFDGWDEHLRWEGWVDAIDTAGIDPQQYLGTIPTDGRLPWDHLDMQLEPKFLLRDYKRSLKDKLSPPCGKPVGAQVHYNNVEEHDADQRLLVCYNCGVACDMEQMRDERREFLLKLKAFAPATEHKAREVVAAKQARIKRGAAPNAMHQDDEQVRVRIGFSKTGAAAMTGHLDMTRKILRIFRRAQLPIWYTEGYHPKPAVSFGPALPLGVQSLGEWMEIKFTRRMHPGQLLTALRDNTEPGIDFHSCEILEEGDARLAKDLTGAATLITTPAPLDDTGRLRAGVEAFHARETWPVILERKKGAKELDLKDLVTELSLADDDTRAYLRRELGAAPEGPALILRQRLDAGVQVKPSEILELVFGEPVDLQPAVHLIRLGVGLQSRGNSTRESASNSAVLRAGLAT